MDRAILYIAAVLGLIGLVYFAGMALRTIRRVGLLRFTKALSTLIVAFVAAGFRFAGGAFSGKSRAADAVGKTPDPFLSPLEKSPAAQSPLIENPIDNPEGYYVDD